MWFLRRHRPSAVYFVLFPVLLTISIFLSFSTNPFSTDVVYSIKETLLPKNRSGEYLNSRINLTANTAACQSDDILIVYVLSTATNFDRRQMIRATWASPLVGTCFVFVLGRALSSPAVQHRIAIEKRVHKDMVQIDHPESYANVVYKEVAALHWSAHFYPSIPYLFKTDDDLIVDTLLVSSIAQLLVSRVQNSSSYLARHRPTLVTEVLAMDRTTLFRGGWSMGYQTTLREGKFGVSQSVWPHPVLPLYCSGFGWLMSNDVRNRLVDASYTYPVNKTAWIGDVFVSGFLAKAAKVQCDGIAIDFEQTMTGKCACYLRQRPMLTVCSSTLHGGGAPNETAKFSEFEQAWEAMKQRHVGTAKLNATDVKEC